MRKIAPVVLIAAAGLWAQRAPRSGGAPAAGQVQAQQQPKNPAAAPPEQEISMTASVFAPGYRFTSERDLIEIPAVVADSDGKLVAGLSESDFQIFDNGKPQQISLFTREERAPPAPPPAAAVPALAPRPAAGAAAPRQRAVALLFDDLNTDPEDLNYARRAARRYIATGWAPGDRIAILTTSEKLTLNFTDDRDALAKAIGQVASNSEILAGTPATMPSQLSGLTEPMHGGGNSDEMLEVQSQHSLDGIRDAIAYTARQPGDKTVVLASVGFSTDFPSNGANLEHEMDLLIAAALHTQVVVNALDAGGLTPTGTGKGDPLDRWQMQTNVLSTIAQDTGGTFFENGNGLAQAFNALGGGPQVSYLLGFSPAGLKPDGAYHRLSVKVATPGAKVQARVGYYAPTKIGSGSVALDLETKLDRALAGQLYAELSATASCDSIRAPDGATGVNVVVQLDTKALPFQRQEGRSLERLRYVAVLSDPAGHYVIGQQGIMNLSLRDASRAELAKTGLKTGIPLPARPGAYQLRVVVQEGAKGQTAALAPIPVTVLP